MTNLIVEISKYLMILLMAVYTYANFRVFSPKDEKKTGWGCRAQCGAMFAIHFLAYRRSGALWPHFTVPRPYFSCAISAFPG